MVEGDLKKADAAVLFVVTVGFSAIAFGGLFVLLWLARIVQKLGR